MKRIISILALSFIFTVFLTVSTQAQTQEPVKKTVVEKTPCKGHNDATKKADCKGHDQAATKSDGAHKKNCANAKKKCPSTCPHAKAAAEAKEKEALENKKRTPVPQK